MNSSWGIQVPFANRELLSSWLVRVAITFGCDPLVLSGNIWPKWRAWTQDIDRGLSQERLARLSQVAGLTITEIESSTLLPIAGLLVSTPEKHVGTWPWILSLGCRNRKHSGGIQFCPLCLTADERQYYRIDWRLAWHTGCEKHGVRLLDSCPACHAPIQPQRLLATDAHLGICTACKFDLRNSPVIPALPNASIFQSAADDVLHIGYGIYQEKSVSPKVWFLIVRYYIGLLRKVTRGKPALLRSFVNEFGIDPNGIIPPSSGLALELLPTIEREHLISHAFVMLRVETKEFLRIAAVTGITQQALMEEKENIPKEVYDIISSLPENKKSEQRKMREVSHKPRSVSAVKKMWTRLQRKLLRVR